MFWKTFWWISFGLLAAGNVTLGGLFVMEYEAHQYWWERWDAESDQLMSLQDEVNSLQAKLDDQIEARQKAEKAAAESERKAQALLKALPDMDEIRESLDTLDNAFGRVREAVEKKDNAISRVRSEIPLPDPGPAPFTGIRYPYSRTN